MAFFSWSKTATNNSTADSSINWSEGQSPSSINDSARAMMARLAEYRDDVSGVLTTGGTSTAYTLTTNEGLASVPVDGQLIAFTPHVTNGTAPTLVADGGTVYALQSAAGTAIPDGSLVQGTPYTAKFVLASAAWVMRNFYGNQFNIPLGGVLDYAGLTAPNSNFALSYGQAISRTTYATLFALIGTTYGAGNGTTTFNLPDLRGRVVAGSDNMGGSQALRITISGGNFNANGVGATGGLENHTLTTAELPVHTPSGTNSAITATGTTGTENSNHNHTGTTGTESAAHTHSTPVTTPPSTSLQGSGIISPNNGWNGAPSAGTTGTESATHTHDFATSTQNPLHTHNFTSNPMTPTFTGNPIGSGNAHTILPPMIILSKIIRIF